jgi:hypothetical protein
MVAINRDEVVAVGLGAKRSPLLVRSTECVSARSLRAAPAVFVATAKVPANKQPNTAIATRFFAALGSRLLPLWKRPAHLRLHHRLETRTNSSRGSIARSVVPTHRKALGNLYQGIEVS